MEFGPEHIKLRRIVKDFVKEEINPRVDDWEESGMFPARELFRKLGDLGLLGLSYSKDFGGAGKDYSFNIALAEELGQIDCFGVPLAIAVQTDMATPALAEYGEKALKEKFLTPAVKGDMVAAIAVTEPQAGSDVSAISTTAESDGDNYVINGAKIYITNGCQADWICLLARTGPGDDFRGISMMIVPTDAKGFKVGEKPEKLGGKSSDACELLFENVVIPKSNIIGEEGTGFALQMWQFQKERLITAALACSSMLKAIKQTARRLKKRRAFGTTLSQNQYIRFRLAELTTEAEALKRLCYFCAGQIIKGRDATREIAMSKLKAGRLIREVADSLLQFYGGYGYMEKSRAARYFRDARMLSIIGGADEIMLSIIAKYERF